MPIIQHLIVDQFGAFLGKHSGRLQVTVKDEKLAEAPLLHLEQVLVTGGGVSLSADAIRACCEAGVPIYFLDAGGHPYAALYAAGLTGTVLTRRAQLLAYTDARGLQLALAFARSKIANQAGFLRYAAKYRQEHQPDVYPLLCAQADAVQAHSQELQGITADNVEQARELILSVEGRAAQEYWDALRLLVPASYQWPGRRTRGAKDPLNAALNYGYGILYGQVERALVLAGLDPYGGFIHADRPGKPSLVFDLIEEFRTVVVDRTVVAMATKGTPLHMDDRGTLTEATRRAIAEKVLERLQAPERYQNKRQPLRIIIQNQARQIATFVRGDRSAYTPFIARW